MPGRIPPARPASAVFTNPLGTIGTLLLGSAIAACDAATGPVATGLDAPEVAAFSVATSSSGSVVFSDGTFAPADWTMDVFATAAAGASTQQASDGLGNPDPYGIVTHTLGGGPPSEVLVVQIKQSAEYDPATAGAIASIDYQEHARTLATEFNTWGGLSRAALRQGSELYVSASSTPTREDFTSPVLPSPWITIAFTGLEAGSFCRVIGSGLSRDCSQNPDFSADGAPIRFGFARENSHTFSFTTNRVSAIDNWSVTVMPASPPPPAEPPSNVSILQPVDGTTVVEGASVTFSGTAEDPADGTLTGGALVWTSSVDGQLGTGEALVVGTLSLGTHEIALTATNSAGLSTSAFITITVLADEPPPIPTQINDLKHATVNSLLPQRVIHGRIQALLTTLNNAELSVRRGNGNAAVNQMTAYMHQLDALFQSRQIDFATWDSLNAGAHGIVLRIQATM